MIAIRNGEAVPAAALLDYLRQIIANNRAGGWRKLKVLQRSSAVDG